MARSYAYTAPASAAAAADAIYSLKASRALAKNDLAVLRATNRLEPATGVAAFDNVTTTAPMLSVDSGNPSGLSISGAYNGLYSCRTSAVAGDGKVVQVRGLNNGNYSFLSLETYSPSTRKVSLSVRLGGTYNSASAIFSAVPFATSSGLIGMIYYNGDQSGAANATRFWSPIAGSVAISTGTLLANAPAPFDVVALSDNSILFAYAKSDGKAYFQRLNAATGAVLTAETAIDTLASVVAIVVHARAAGGFAVYFGSSGTNYPCKLAVYDATFAQSALVSVPGTAGMPNINYGYVRSAKYLGELSDGRIVLLAPAGPCIYSAGTLASIPINTLPNGYSFVYTTCYHHHLHINEDDEIIIVVTSSATDLLTTYAVYTAAGSVITTGSVTTQGAVASLSATPNRYACETVRLGGRYFAVLRCDWDNNNSYSPIALSVVSPDDGSLLGSILQLKPTTAGINSSFSITMARSSENLLVIGFTEPTTGNLYRNGLFVPFSMSVLGVATAAFAANTVASVGTIGVKTINQNYAVPSTFDRRSASPVGNAGVLFGQSVNLKGLL